MSKPDTRNATKNKFHNQENKENKEENLENINEEDEIIKNLYHNNHAEIISKIMLEKIISLTVTNIHSKEIYTNLGNYCFKYIKEMIKPAMKMNFIPYEIRHNEKEKIFFDRPKCDKHNTWIEIEEPKTPINDRFTCDQIKYSEFTPIEFDIIQSSNVSNSNFLFIDKDLNISEIKDNEKNENELPIKKLTLRNISKKTTENIKRTLSKNVTKKNDIEEEIKEKEKEKPKRDNKGEGPWIDLPSYDLPEEIYLNKYLKNDNNPEIIELRKEMELEIKKREEQKRIEEELRRRELNNIIQQKKKIKDFDPKKYTFDSNGKILKLKPKNTIESNLGNEFYWSKPITKDIRTFRHQFIKAPRNSFAHMKNRKLNDFTEGIPQAKSSKKLNINFKVDEIEDEEEEEENDDNNNEKKLKRRISTKLGKKTIKKMREETEIIRNPNNGDPFKTNKFGFKNTNKKNDYIIPSGQNFEMIVPEVGVTIINSDKKKKEGGLNFTEKFKKPSMEQFSKLAFDTENLNSKRFLTGSLSQDKILNSEINNQNNYIGYSQQFSNENNPLIQNSHSEIKRESLSQTNILNNQSFLSYMNPYKSQLLNEIQLTKKMGNVPNLKILFNDNDNFSSFDNKKKYKSTRPTGSNLFRRNISQNFIGTLTDDYIITDEKNIDNFNSKIIKNRNWGSNNEKLGDKINYFVKPHKSNHIRELGFRIVNTRMPRDRKFVFSSNFLPNRKIGFESLKDNDNKEKNIDINSK